MVEEFYWFGGFGDRAYIGWIPIEEWRGVTEEEVANARLVGEKGYKGGGSKLCHKRRERVRDVWSEVQKGKSLPDKDHWMAIRLQQDFTRRPWPLTRREGASQET